MKKSASKEELRKALIRSSDCCKYNRWKRSTNTSWRWNVRLKRKPIEDDSVSGSCTSKRRKKSLKQLKKRNGGAEKIRWRRRLNAFKKKLSKISSRKRKKKMH